MRISFGEYEIDARNQKAGGAYPEGPGLSTRRSRKVVSESEMNSHARACGKFAAKYSKSEREVLSDGVTPADLGFELAPTQVEVIRYATKHLGA
jgi:hypothetical protein